MNRIDDSYFFAGQFDVGKSLRHEFFGFAGSERLDDGLDRHFTGRAAFEFDSHPPVT